MSTDVCRFCVIVFGPDTIDTYGINSIILNGYCVYIYTLRLGTQRGNFQLDVNLVQPVHGDPLLDLVETQVDPGIILDYLYDQGIIPFGGGEPFELKTF